MLQTKTDWNKNSELWTLTEQLTIQPLEKANPAGYPDAVKSYFAHYGLDTPPDSNVEHIFGSFCSGGFTLAAHLYKPQTSAATVLLLHGYLNHCGQFKHLIRELLERDFAVALFDLPGHGLSDGSPAEIDSFEQYLQAVDDFISNVRTRLNPPYYAVGFSTGAAILIDIMLTAQTSEISRFVLVAPLIHWTLYEQSKGTYKVYSTFTDRIARFHRKNSSDSDFLIFNRTQDYLHLKYLSLKWVKALFDWNERLQAYPASGSHILVIQGDCDGTVDWRYNLELIRSKFPNADIQMIMGANHELFNESPEFRKQAIGKIVEFFALEHSNQLS